MTNDNTATETFEPTAGQKRLLRVVYAMGIALALLFIALIGGIIWKATQPKPVPPAVEQVQDLKLDPASIRHIALDGDRLAVTTDREVVVIDLRSKSVLLRLPQKP